MKKLKGKIANVDTDELIEHILNDIKEIASTDADSFCAIIEKIYDVEAYYHEDKDEIELISKDEEIGLEDIF